MLSICVASQAGAVSTCCCMVVDCDRMGCGHGVALMEVAHTGFVIAGVVCVRRAGDLGVVVRVIGVLWYVVVDAIAVWIESGLVILGGGILRGS